MEKRIMNTYTIYSQSHFELLQIFLKTLCTVEPDIRITVKSMPQIGAGEYGKPEMYVASLRKIELIIEAMQENNEPFIYADCDIVFLKPFIEDLKKELGLTKDNTYNEAGEVNSVETYYRYDLLAQIDYENPLLLCAGFMVIRPCEKTYNFFKIIYQKILESFRDKKPLDDQFLLNQYVHNLNYKALDKTYSNIGQLNGYKIWDGGEFEVPKDIKIWHSNYVVGAEKKLLLTKQVLNKFKI